MLDDDDEYEVPVEREILKKVNQLQQEMRTLKRDYMGIIIFMLALVLGFVWRIHDKMGL